MSGPAVIAVEQPTSFAFSGEYVAAVDKVIAKYPEGRQASAVLPLLDLAQRQHGGWVPQAAIEHIAEKLGMAKIRVMEVVTFYTMINLAPVGKYHLQVCGTTPCMLRGSDDVFRAIKEELGIGHGETSEDGLFTCTEVECLGACVNSPMVQVNDDFVEDLDHENFTGLLRSLKNGGALKTGSMTGRTSSEPAGGALTLKDVKTPPKFDPSKIYGAEADDGADASAKQPVQPPVVAPAAAKPADDPVADDKVDTTGAGSGSSEEAPPTAVNASAAAEPSDASVGEAGDADRPTGLAEPRGGKADELTRIKGIGPKIEGILNSLGIFHFDQISAWSPAEKDWVNGYLQFKGRIDREAWIEQAEAFIRGGGH